MKNQKTIDIERQNYMMTLKIFRVCATILIAVAIAFLGVVWVSSIKAGKIRLAINCTIFLVPFAVAMLYAIKISKILKDGETPFRVEVANFISKAGYALVYGGFIGYLCFVYLIKGAENFALPFFIAHSANCLIGPILTLIAYAFKYGCKLQQESDETI